MFLMSTSATKRTTYHHGNLRAALLEAARALVLESGLDGFGLREVSRRAGVSHAAAYNHFANRSALVTALVVEAFGALAEALAAAERLEATPFARLRTIGVAYVRFAFEHPAEFKFMFRPELCADPLAPSEQVAGASRESYSPLERAIAACLADGSLTGDAETLALTAWAAVHGLASLVVDGPLRNDGLDLAAVDALARGVTASLFSAAAR